MTTAPLQVTSNQPHSTSIMMMIISINIPLSVPGCDWRGVSTCLPTAVMCFTVVKQGITWPAITTNTSTRQLNSTTGLFSCRVFFCKYWNKIVNCQLVTFSFHPTLLHISVRPSLSPSCLVILNRARHWCCEERRCKYSCSHHQPSCTPRVSV